MAWPPSMHGTAACLPSATMRLQSRRREGDLEVVRIGGTQSFEAVEKLQTSLDRVLGRDLAGRHVARPPLDAQVAVPDSRQV